MIRFATLITLFAAAPLFGQTKEVVEEMDALLARQRIAERIAVRHAEERTEDIEVLRRLLNKAFGFDHVTSQLAEPLQPYMMGSTGRLPGGGGGWPSGWPGGQPGGITGFAPQPDWTAKLTAVPIGKHVSQAVGPFDGVYLKGSGVVFTLRVPKEEMQFGHGLSVGSADKNLGLGSTCNGCHNEAKAAHKGVDPAVVNDCTKCHMSGTVTSATLKPVSDWDRIRADVRGEKLPDVKPVAIDPKKPRAVMCKPGDLRELLTAQLHAHAKNVRNLDKNDWVWVVVTFDEVPGAKASQTLASTTKTSFSEVELQAVTLGELHLKQGKYKESLESFEKGLARFLVPGRSRFIPFAGVSEAESRKSMQEHLTFLRTAHQSLAKAALQLGDVDKAKRSLDFLAGFRIELGDAKDAAPAKPQLPAKLVLAVAKSDIDRNPKLEEFRKGAHVELVGFPKEPEKK